MKTYLGMDFGGTKLLIGEMDENGNILNSKKYATGAATQEQAIKILLDAAKDYRDTVGFTGEIQAAGVGIVGVVDHDRGEWISINHIVTGPPVPLAAILSEELSVPVAIDNDVRSATTAEWKLGRGKSSRNFIYLNVGTGLAAGFVVNGMILRGANNNSGEVGHMVVDIQNPYECICGRLGCAENMVSGSGFAKQARFYDLQEVLLEDRPNSADTPKLFELADAGEERAVAITEYAADTLAAVIMNLVRVSDPDTVILGGGVVTGGWMLQKIRSRLNASTMRGVKNGVVLSEFAPQYAGLIGAASLGIVLMEENKKGGRDEETI
ncbi:MAG: ROK family protein [Eubacteriales bacterium]|nr:ROK family protein [Eubacteriales bacterium]